MKQAEQGAQPPGGPVQLRERRGLAEGEALPDGQVDEEPGNPGPVGVLGDEGSQQQGEVEAGQPGELGPRS